MTKRLGAALVLCITALLASCGGGDDGGSLAAREPATKPDKTSADAATATTLDPSPFCVAIRALEALGAASTSGESTPAKVLEQNGQLAGLIDDAATNAPQDAPPGVAALLEDYRAITRAVTAAEGDAQAAMTALNAESPELMGRLGDATVHREAFSYFADLCGTAPPA